MCILSVGSEGITRQPAGKCIHVTDVMAIYVHEPFFPCNYIENGGKAFNGAGIVTSFIHVGMVVCRIIYTYTAVMFILPCETTYTESFSFLSTKNICTSVFTQNVYFDACSSIVTD